MRRVLKGVLSGVVGALPFVLLTLACACLYSATSRGELLGTPQVPRALSAPQWEHGTDQRGQTGWFVVRKDSDGRSWIYASDQPSGRQEPCFVHKRPANANTFPLGLSGSLGYSVGGAAVNYGVNMAQLAAGTATGGQVLTNDPAFGGKLMADMQKDAEGPCPGPVCPPKKPDEPADEPADEPVPAADIRQYIVPGACALAVLATLFFIRRRAVA